MPARRNREIVEELSATRVATAGNGRRTGELANEELKSSNEEYQSTNEELQATNEELETAKEEMQSVNEELQTINAELATKNDLLTTLNNDMQNLLDSTQIATLFLDKDLRVTRFTPRVTELFRLRAIDVGRPITEIASRAVLCDDDGRREGSAGWAGDRRTGDPAHSDAPLPS